jgi:DEAD/DEAH box helicase domain-containing protein
MAGTSDREGRLSEFRRTRSGVMFATNALEAGVDIGDLEVVIIDGYPGSRMAFRQMAGRAGRIAPVTMFAPASTRNRHPQERLQAAPPRFHRACAPVSRGSGAGESAAGH